MPTKSRGGEKKKKYETVHPQSKELLEPNKKPKVSVVVQCSGESLQCAMPIGYWLLTENHPSSILVASRITVFCLECRQGQVYHSGGKKFKAISVASISFLCIALRTSPGIRQTSSQKQMAKLHQGTKIKLPVLHSLCYRYPHILVWNEKMEWKGHLMKIKGLMKRSATHLNSSQIQTGTCTIYIHTYFKEMHWHFICNT